MNKPADTSTTVYVAVARELLPKLYEWSEPVRIRVDAEDRGVIHLRLKRHDGSAA